MKQNPNFFFFFFYMDIKNCRNIVQCCVSLWTVFNKKKSWKKKVFFRLAQISTCVVGLVPNTKLTDTVSFSNYKSQDLITHLVRSSF